MNTITLKEHDQFIQDCAAMVRDCHAYIEQAAVGISLTGAQARASYTKPALYRLRARGY